MAELIEARSDERPGVLAYVDVLDKARADEIGAALLECGYAELAVRRRERYGDELELVLDEVRAEAIPFVLWLDGLAVPGKDSVARLVEALLADESLAGAGPIGPRRRDTRPRLVSTLTGFVLYRADAFTAGPPRFVPGSGRLAALPWVAAEWKPGEAP